MDEKYIKRLIANLKNGIAKVESGGFKNPYEARPPVDEKTGKRASSATGKYQFLKAWLNDTVRTESGKLIKRKNANGESVMGIASFAKSLGVYDEITSMDDFRNLPELQEAYFEYYARNVLIPEGTKIAAKNPLGLSEDEIMAQVHFQGYTKARDTVQSGKLLDKTDTNVSQAKYTKIYRTGRDEAGLGPVTATEIIEDKRNTALANGTNPDFTDSEKKIIKNNDELKEKFRQENNNLNEMVLSNESREVMRNKLFQKYVNNGHRDVVNEAITDINKEKAQDLSEYKELIAFAEKSKFQFNPDHKTGSKSIGKDALFVPWKDSDDAQVEKLNKKYNFVSAQSETGKYVLDSGKLFDALKQKHKSVTGKDLDIDKNILKGNKDVDVQKDGWFGLIQSLDDLAHFKKPSQYANIDLTNEPPIEAKQLPLLDKKRFPKQSDPIEEKIKEEDQAEADAKSEEGKAEETTATEEETSENNGLLDEYLKTELALNTVKDNKAAYGSTKQELPINAIVGLSLGLIGNEQAKNANIPLRTEQISEAVKRYAAEISERKEMGLPVEVEAQMRNKLAEVYQGGLANIVNASGGNRATVLGNQGALESNKQKGLLAIQVADFEAKDRAFQEYGKVMQYMNDFDSRREIQNHAIQYGEAKRTQKNGTDLATAGFSQLTEAIRYQQQNGPGSANDMYRSKLEQDIFGFDSKRKDDGTGKPGTKSAYEMSKVKLDQRKADVSTMYEKLNTLNPEQRAVANQMWASSKNEQATNDFIDYIKVNPDTNLADFSMDNFDEALGKNDFGLLTQTTDPTTSTEKVQPDQAEATSIEPKPEPVANKGLISEGLMTQGLKPITTDGLNPIQTDPLKEKEEENPFDMTLSESGLASMNAMNDYYQNQ